MNTEEVANRVVDLTRKQEWMKAVDELYADDIVSVEAFSRDGDSTETRGLEGIRGKVDWWVGAMEVHEIKVSGPFVAHDRFVVQYEMDFSDRSSQERRQMSEVGVYTVKDGKIVREEFLPSVENKC